MGIIEAIDAVDIQTAGWLFIAGGGYLLYKMSNNKK